MPKQRAEPELTDQQIAQRRDEAVRRALNTPPKPLKDMIVERKAKLGRRVKTVDK
jgi:hypothetical protein